MPRLRVELISVGHPGFDRLRGRDAALHALDDILRHIAVGRTPCLAAARSVSGRRSAYRNKLLGIALALAIASLVPAAAQDVWQHQGNTGPVPQIGGRGAARAAIGIDSETRLRIDKALDYLYRSQNVDGSWTDRVGRKVHTTYRGQVAPHVGVTALAGIAFLSSGTLPGGGPRERYCTAVRKALDFVISNTQENGFITANGSRMYSHAFATLFLAEAYGTPLYPDAEKLHSRLKDAVRLIVKSQNKEGGWRYLPGAPDADMSITVCQVMALRAARNGGVQVPKDTIQQAVNYVKRSFIRPPEGGGAFKYQIEPVQFGGQHRWSFALTACGVTALYGAGEYSAPQVREGLAYLWFQRPPRQIAPYRFDYFYGQYYAVQAAFQAGGDYWIQWYDSIRKDLLTLQEDDGSWLDLVGPNYATAMAAIILQMPNQYLPIMEN